MTTPRVDKPAFGGLRVVEIGGMVAAPFCGKLLAALGADVIKIEPPRVGDPSRRRGPFPGDVPHPERSGLFLYLNTGKRGITLNLDDPQGINVFAGLLGRVDVALHDLPPDRASRLGLSPETVAKNYPDLIAAAVTPFGSSGPNANYAARDITVFHAGGEGNLLPNGLALDQFPERPPITAGSFMGSYQGGITAAVGIAAAVFAKWSGQTGQTIDCSLQEAQLAIGYLPVQRLESEGFVESRFSRFFRMGGVLPALDGYVELLTLEPRQWQSLARFVGQPEWAQEEKFQDPAAHGAEINENLRRWSRDHPKEWLYQEGQRQGVPFAPYYTPGEVFESPQQRSRDFFQPIDHPQAGRYDYPGLPWRMTETPPVLERAPLLGEHNVEVFRELGYSGEEMVALARSEVI